MSRSGDRPGSAGAHLTRAWRRRWLLALGAFALVLVLVRLAGSPPPSESWEPIVRPTALDRHPPLREDPGDCAGAPTGVLIVAWDGADWAHVLPLIDAGRMPNLAALMERGARGNLYGFRPSLSPALWTSVVTGVSPLRHAIHGFEKPRSRTLPWSLGRLLHWGREPFELASNGDRRAPALWNLIDASGGSSIVVGWHNTYPAEPIRGVMVSNLLVWSRGAGPGRGPDQQPDPFTSGLIHPASQSEAVLDVTRAVEDALEREIVRFADFTPQELGRFQRESERPAGDGGDWSYFLRQAYVYDTIHARLAAQLLSERSPTATLVHLQALDLIGHNLLWFHRPEEFDAMDWSEQDRRMLAQATPRWGRTLTEFHVYLDEWLGELVALAGPHRAVLVLSDHGFEPNDDPLHSGHHEGAPPGIFVLAGPGLRRGVHIDASVYDVLPTVLALLGLPVARDLDGRVLEGAFCPDQLPAVRWVDTFLDRGPFTPAIPPPAALRRELEERLHSLGYTR